MFKKSIIFNILVICVVTLVINSFYGVNASVIDWSTLTADQLNNVTLEEFTFVTAENISVIPSSACSGFKAQQIASISDLACSGFKSDCFKNIPPTSYSGFKPNCVSNWTVTEMNGIVSEFMISNLAAEVFTVMTKNHTANLVASACRGIDVQKISLIQSTGCGGFSKECVSNIPVGAFKGITGTNCFFTPSGISGLSKYQIANIVRTNFEKWTKEMIAALEGEVCQGITSSQMNDLREYSPNNVCIGFTSSCIMNIPVDSFTAVNPGCINNLNLTAISAAQLKVLPSVSFPWLYENTIRKLNGDVCSGLTSAQIGQLTSQCVGFSKECVRYIPSTSFTGISDSCFFTTDAIYGLNKDQLNNLPRNNFAKWTKDMIASIPADACKGITSSQMNDLREYSPNNVCIGFTGSCIANIPVDSFTAVNPGCINNLNLTAVSAAQLKVLPSVSFPWLYDSTIRKLNGDVCSGITKDQIAQLTTQCSAFTKDCLSYIPKESLPGLTDTCVFSTSAIPGLNKDQINSISRTIFAKWTKSMMAAISSDACQGITIHQMNDLYGAAGDACAGFTPSCIANIPTNSFSALNPGCINNINLTAVSANQFTVIPYVAFPYVTSTALKKLSGNTCSGFTASQIGQITTQCSGFTKECLSYIPSNIFTSLPNTCFFSTDAIPGLTKEQITNINRANFAKWNKNMMAAINSDSCKGITIHQMNDLYGDAGDACAGFTSACVANIPTNSFSALNPGCINNINLTAVSANQFAVIPYNSLQYVTQGTLQKLRGSTCSGITGNQLGILTTQCADFTSDCLSYIPNDSFRSIASTSTCFFSINAIPGLRKEQITNINRANFAKWNKNMMAAISGETCQGITIHQMNDLYGTAGDACAGFTPSCIANIPTNSFSALNPGCINNINMTAVSSNQFTVIPYVAFPYVYSETVAKLRGNICSGFTRDQLASMSSQCVNLNADCINYVATPSLERMSPNCLEVITQQNILGFTKDQLVSLTSFTLGGITANQLVTLYNNPAYSISNLLNATQIETVDSNVILTFKKRFESGLLTPNRIILSDEIGSTLTWLQLAVSTKSSVSQIMNSNSIITVAFNKTFQGLRSDHIQALENEIFKNTNINQLDNLLIDIFSTINAEQLSNIPLVGFSTKDKALYKTFNGVNPTAIPGINQPQLSAIIVNIPSTLWTCEQFRNLTEQQVQWFKVESVDTFNTISQRCSQPEPQPSPIPSVSPKPSLSNPVPKPSSFKPQPTASLKPGSSPKPSTKPQPTTSLKPHVSTSKIGSPKPSAKPAMSSKAISNPPRGNPRVSEGSNLAVYSLWMLIISLLISLLL